MLGSLKIQNYILIDEIEIQFSKGFNVITGETGSGKSLLLGALGLLFGQRADTSSLKDHSKKCIIEGEILIKNNSLKSFFTEHDIEFNSETIVRREIAPTGKSRAFINDTPVVLKVLEQFSFLIFDLHSQNQNLLIKDEAFRLSIIDTIAQTSDILAQYQSQLHDYSTLKTQIDKQTANYHQNQKELDFYQFQFDQLESAHLQVNEQEAIEQELEELNHSEEIKRSLSIAFNCLSEVDPSAISLLIQAQNALSALKSYYKPAEEFLQRIQSNIIDLQDLAPEIESRVETIVFDSQRIEELNDRLNLINTLQRKHKVSTIAELIEIKNDFDEKLSKINNFSFEIEQEQKQLASILKNLKTSSEILSSKRQAVFQTIENQILEIAVVLGMPKAKFKIDHQFSTAFNSSGQDEIKFLFSANSGMALEELSKIASGGEMSRLMLALKNLISKSSHLSTLILDEIDTGVSGEVADKMGKLMQQMALNRQLIVITHLPQIAAKGDVHFKVNKNDNDHSTVTEVIELKKDERLMEIAQLLSGENISKAAISNAKELLTKP